MDKTATETRGNSTSKGVPWAGWGAWKRRAGCGVRWLSILFRGCGIARTYNHYLASVLAVNRIERLGCPQCRLPQTPTRGGRGSSTIAMYHTAFHNRYSYPQTTTLSYLYYSILLNVDFAVQAPEYTSGGVSSFGDSFLLHVPTAHHQQM